MMTMQLVFSKLFSCRFLVLVLVLHGLAGCGGSADQGSQVDLKEISLSEDRAREKAELLRAEISAEVDPALELTLWASDTLLADPVALDMDDRGRAFVTRTNRRRSSEFDIRRYPEWEEASISFQSVEDRRGFIRNTHTPENSGTWNQPFDLNGDSLQTWEDLTIESEEVYRIEDRSGDGIADYTALVATGFNTEITDIAGGVLFHDESVYLSVAPDLWRLQDEDGDGYMELRESLMYGFQVHIGFGGHNMSGLKIGPDGKIYWGIGDIGFNGTDQDGKQWKYPNQGVIVRCNPDGSDFEVFAAGLRNTHEFTFDDYGNLISVDNDGDHPGESERLVYLLDGSDSGWRINWQFGKYRDPKNNDYKVWMDEELYKPRFEGQAAFILPCIRNYINGPTGMVYNPGAGMGRDWQDHFFVVEFNGNPARSGIHSFKLEPKGAGFAFKSGKKIMGGVLATGLDFGADGALYFTDWIDGWAKKGYGRIWKLDAKSDNLEGLRAETKVLLESDFKAKNEEELGLLLGHPDQRIRRKSQFELVRRGDISGPLFLDELQQSDDQMKRIHCIWGLGQLAASNVEHAADLTAFLGDEDAEIRAQVAKTLGSIKYKDAGDALMDLLQDPNPRVRLFAAEALGRSGETRAVDGILDMLRQNNDEDAHLRHAGIVALARIGDVDRLASLADSDSRALRIAAVVALRRMTAPQVQLFLNDEDEDVVAEAARAINDDFSVEAALPALADLLITTDFDDEVLIRRAINANNRVGTDKAIANLITYAADKDNDSEMRKEAVAVLGVWANPSVFDRVDGRYRGEVDRDSSQVLTLAGLQLTELLLDPDLLVRESAAHAIGRLGHTAAIETLVMVVEEDSEPRMRATALNTLYQLKAPNMPELLDAGLDDANEEVRIAAIHLINEINADPDQLAQMLTTTLEQGSTTEQQAAIQALSQLPKESTFGLIENMLKRLARGEVKQTIQLDLIEVAEDMEDPKLDALISSYRGSFDIEGEVVNYMECLEGGDAQRGRDILINNSNAQCLKCHNIRGYGGVAGPALDDIGARMTPVKMVQSMVDPSAEIAAGFGVVTLILNDDSAVSGVLIKENSEELIVRDSEEKEITVTKSDIKERINAVSSMPSMTDILSKHEIRDLVAFLSELKETQETEQEGEGEGSY